MAQRKLSPTQRTAIRRQIQKGLSSELSQAEVLRRVAKKYRISPVSARWYLKGNGSGNGKARHASHPKRKAKKVRRFRKHSPTKASRNGNGVRILDAVRGLSREQLRRALTAKAMLPQLESARRRHAALKEQAQRVVKATRAAERHARQLERRLRKLTRS